MAVLRSGILGNIRGKVAGVVGSQWKDKNYLREFVKPANPNTAAQQTQRTKLSDCVAFAKWLVGPIFNAYTDKFQKSMSGFNYFLKQYISEFDGSPLFADILITEGKLSPLIMTKAEYNSGSGNCDITFDTNYGNNGLATDKVYAAVYNYDNGLWYFPVGEVDRSTGTITVACDTSLTLANTFAWIFAAAYINTIVSMISNSDARVAEAP